MLWHLQRLSFCYIFEDLFEFFKKYLAIFQEKDQDQIPGLFHICTNHVMPRMMMDTQTMNRQADKNQGGHTISENKFPDFPRSILDFP